MFNLDENQPIEYQTLLAKEQLNLLIKEVERLPQRHYNIIIAALHGVYPAEYARLTNKGERYIAVTYVEAITKLRKAINRPRA